MNTQTAGGYWTFEITPHNTYDYVMSNMLTNFTGMQAIVCGNCTMAQH